MNNSLTINNNSKKRRFRFSSMAFIMLGMYMAITVLCYIEFIPAALSSLALYGFVGLSAITLMVYKKPRIPGYSLWLLTFLGICAFSCIYSADRAVSMTATFGIFKLFLFSFMMYNIVDCNERFERVLMINSGSTVILILYLMYTGELFVEDERLGETLTGNANLLAGVLMFGAFCSVYFISFAKSRFHKFIFVVCFLLQAFALSLTGSRKFFILPLVLFCAMLVLNTNRKGKRHIVIKSVFAVALIILVFWVLFNVDFFYNAIGYRMEGLFNMFSGEGEVDASSLARQELLEQAIEFWKLSPVAGNGIDTFKVLSSYGVYSHNNYGELLCDVGVVGFITYYVVYLYILKKLFALRTKSVKKWFWIGVIVCLAIYDVGAVTYDSYRNHMLFILALLITKKENADILCS